MSYGDGLTEKIKEKLDIFSDRIWSIDDGLASIDDNEDAIIAYLNDICSASAMGIALRRYFCKKFGNKLDDGGYSFVLQNGSVLQVGDYLKDDYDVENDDIKAYSDIFYDIYLKYNAYEPISTFTKAEARRLLRMDSACQRKKMFTISFALHVNTEDMDWFLMDVLAEQSYNLRNPQEIIAYFCHSQEQYNSYAEYVRLTEAYFAMSDGKSTEQKQKKANYTLFANDEVKGNIHTEEELLKYLCENRAEFHGASQTAYWEFRNMYDKACKKATYQRSSNDDYIRDATFASEKARLDFEESVNRSTEIRKIENSKKLADKLGVDFIGNPEQLAYAMLACIPRATFEREQKDKKVVETDFISISNGESGQKKKKVQTTKLPRDITMNLLMRDRLDDLLCQKETVKRKDLIFLKYFLFSLYLQEKDSYTVADYIVFTDECNDMLQRCGMSRLYLANRFENLILLSLVSKNPFEMFENIIECSFINEPKMKKAEDE